MNKKILVMFAFAVLLIGVTFVSAADYSGDGTYTLGDNDTLTLDNGWKIQISSSFMEPDGEHLNFLLKDTNESFQVMNSLYKYEGRRKFGTETTLKTELEVLELSGETSATGSPLVSRYQKVKINAASIDEKLPGKIESNPSSEIIEEVNKTLSYPYAREITIKFGESYTFENGYSLNYGYFNQHWGTASISSYDSNGNAIGGEDVVVGVTKFVSPYSLIAEELTSSEAKFKLIEGMSLVFGTGWNLFSIPLEDGDGYGTVLESTCNNGTIWSWNAEAKDYEKIGILQEGLKLPARKGLWVKIQTRSNWVSDTDCEIIVSGTQRVTTLGQKLKAGWNLIGAPVSSASHPELNKLLGDCRIEKGPWQFISTMYTSPVYFAEATTNYGKYSQSQNNIINLNRGYFIKVIDDCTLGDLNSSETSTQEENTPSLTGTQKYTLMKNIGGYTYLESYSQYAYLGRDYHKAIYDFEGENVSVFVNIFNSTDVKEDYKNILQGRYTTENNLTGITFYQLDNYVDPDMQGFFWESNGSLIEIDGSSKSDKSLFEAYRNKYN